MAQPAAATIVARSGPGALCAEAQADGVPCAVLGIACDACAMARAVVAADAFHADDARRLVLRDAPAGTRPALRRHHA